ncbi:LEA type 2 family protein [Aquisalimonas asiatica]|uniref:LEA14-like dessication related protein n=1 Tax=Aquisalimonas asiatica TaxID=406100 RepID=A0A1H8S373_9GAMM|nr:LEA type 2 family protein [Aquisalimonas asiatica]SEO72768.1 LEA14-like dessication related protein [Aquisalimonas asiatica]
MLHARWMTAARRPLLAWLLATLVTLSGCSLFQPELEDPEFRLERIEVLELGMTQQRFMLTLAVDNPNSQSLPVRAIRYDLQVADLDFADGSSDKAFTVAGNETTMVEIEARSQLLSSLPELIRMVHGGQRNFDYAITGSVEYGRFFRGSRDFEQTGSVRLLLD